MCIDEVSTVEPGAEDLGDPESDDDDDDETLDSNPFDRSDVGHRSFFHTLKRLTRL
jgi:hypothetical protein